MPLPRQRASARLDHTARQNSMTSPASLRLTSTSSLVTVGWAACSATAWPTLAVCWRTWSDWQARVRRPAGARDAVGAADRRLVPPRAVHRGRADVDRG